MLWLPYLRAPLWRDAEVLLRTPAVTPAIRSGCGKGLEFFARSPAHAVHSFGQSPVTDVAYLCHNCGSVHEVELIRENLVLDLCAAGSFELSGQRGMLDPRARFLRQRMSRVLAGPCGLGIRIHVWPGAVGGVQGSPAPVSDRPCPTPVSASVFLIIRLEFLEIFC